MFKKKQPTTKILRFHRSTQRELGFITLLVKKIQAKLFNRHDRHRKKLIGRWQKGKKLFLLIAIFILLLLGPTVYLTLIHPKSTEAAPWAQTAGSWTKRKNVILTNNSGQTFEANTTYAVNINTQELVAAGDLNADCSDLRVYYQPTDTTSTKLAYYFDVAAGATNCSDSLATKVYFPLQANLSNGANATEYYIYYDNASAVTEASVDAFNVGSKQALMVCPFNGDTECINGDGAEDPTTESGAIRYGGGKGAISFNGADVSIQADYISLGSPDSLDDMISGKQITFESWVKVDKIGCHQYFTSTDWGGGGGGWHAYWGCDGTPTGSFSIICGTQNAYSLPTTTLPMGEWFHYATTYDDNGDQKIHIFVNGSEVSYTTQNACIGGVVSDATKTKYLWHDEWSSGAKQGGEIDEFRISSVVRYTSNFTPQTSPYVRDEHTKLLLHFDENGDDPRNTGKVIDDSGNGNHGTITGAQYVAGLIGVDASTTDTGKTPSASYASHDGIFIEEGTTNKITNPSFDHSTYNTNWNDATNLTETENSTAQFSKFGSKSAKLVASADDSFYIAINAGNTNSHTLSAYVYDGTSSNVGGTISSSIAALVFNGSAQTTTYTDMGGGWWRLSYSAAAGSGSQNYGVQVKSGKTVYVDGVQLEEKAYSTTYADGTLGTGYSWSGTAHNSTSSRTTAVADYLPTSNISNTAGSVSFWVKTVPNASDMEVANTYQPLFQFGSGDWVDKLLIVKERYTNGISFIRNTSSYDAGRLKIISTPNAFSFGVWQHVVATWDSTAGTKIYLNNGTVAENTATNDWPNPASLIQLAKGTYQSVENRADSTISDLRVFNTAVTSSEVADLYYTGLGSHQIQSDYTERFSGTEGPVLNWHMDEGYGTTAHDSTLKANNGTISGATWNDDTYSSPPQGKSLQFDGSNDYVYRTYTTDDELDPSSLPFSVSTWFKHPSTQAGTDTLIARYANSGYKLYMNSSGYLCFGVDDDSTWGPDDSACTTISYADSQWHLATAVRESTSIALYVDGIKVASDDSLAITGHLSGANPTLYAGIDGDGSSNPWTGFIDDVRVYSHALTTAEILAELSARGSVKGSSTTFTGEGAGGDLSQGLVGYWKMDEASWNGSANEVIDVSGNANHGVRSGDATTTTGKYGKGGIFDGTGDYVDLSDPTSLRFTTAFTYSAYVKPNTFVDGEVLYFGGAGDKIWLRINSIGQLSVYLGGTSSPGYHTSINSLVDAQWNLVTLVYDGTKAKIYINGIFDSEINTSGTLSDSGTRYSVKIGANYAGGGNYFKGDLDEVRLYNRALSPAEVSSLYQYAPGPVAHYSFDEGAGQYANDKSGNGNTGTLGASSSPGNDDPIWTNGKYDKALSFDGSDDYVGLANSNALNFSANQGFTINGWLKTTESYGSVVSFRNSSSSDPVLDINVGYNGDARNAGYLSIYVREDGNGSAAISYTSSQAVNNGQWQYFTLVRSPNSGTINVYLNGVYDGTASSANADGGITTNLRGLGAELRWIQDAYGNTDDRYFVGQIDDVLVYNYARTPQQIVEDMNAGHPAPGSPVGSPIAYYKFDEGYGDTANNFGSSGTSSNGNLAGTCPGDATCPLWTNNGKFGKALNFDGSNDEVTITQKLGGNEGTISGWVNMSGNPDSGYQSVFSQERLNNPAVNGLVFGPGSDGKVALGLMQEWSSWLYVGGNSVLSTDNWYHIAATWKNDGLTTPKIYVNGKLDGFGATTAESIMTAADAHIGFEEESDNYFAGSIDELKVYSSALTGEQIMTEYNMGKSQVLGSLSTTSDGITADNSAARAYCPPGNTESNCAVGQNPAPVAEWNFDEGTGQSANDTTGNGETGTLGSSGSDDSTDPTWVDGKNSKGLSFDGGDYVSRSDTILSSAFTINAWVKPSIISGTQTIFAQGPAYTSRGRLFLDSSGYLVLNVLSANSTSTTALSPNSWYFVTGVFDGTNSYVYINGMQMDGPDADSYVLGDSDRIRIGANPDSSNFFNGTMDTVKIYNYARTPAQIAWDYNRGDPVAHYKLDECTGGTIHSNNEVYNSGFNGTWSGSGGTQTSVGDCDTSGTAWYNGATGKFNGSLNFDGTDDYVSLGDLSILDNSTQASIGMWFKTSSNPSDQRILFDKGNTLRIEFNNSNLQILTGNGSSWVLSNGEVTYANSLLSTNTWHHVVLKFDGQISSLYVDGNLVDYISDSSFNLGNWTDPYCIGDYGASHGTYNFSGQIDDVRIYNYSLSEQQIKLIYNGGQAVNFR